MLGNIPHHFLWFCFLACMHLQWVGTRNHSLLKLIIPTDDYHLVTQLRFQVYSRKIYKSTHVWALFLVPVFSQKNRNIIAQQWQQGGIIHEIQSKLAHHTQMIGTTWLSLLLFISIKSCLHGCNSSEDSQVCIALDLSLFPKQKFWIYSQTLVALMWMAQTNVKFPTSFPISL